MTYWEILLRQLARHGYKYDPDNKFALSSGKISEEYLDCRQALSRPMTLAALGKVIVPSLDPDTMAIGGLSFGADPISISVSHASARSFRPVRWFSIRREQKTHGAKRLIEGDIRPGEAVTVVEDVVTTGASVLKAIKACKDFGLKVTEVIVLVDREEGGLASIRHEVSGPVRAIYRFNDIRRYWHVNRTKFER